MLNKLEKLREAKKANQAGFTIIEVMIVLAIAGLILLIVLLAVPALQRNSRNTTIKSDAASIVGAAATFMSDNEGATPNNIVVADGTATLWESTGAGGQTSVPTGEDTPDNAMTIKIQKSTELEKAPAGGEGSTPTEPTGLKAGILYYRIGETCEPKSSSRTIAIYYVLETSGGESIQCVNS